MDARDELGKGEGFRQVVVGTEVEAFHACIDLCGSRQHQDSGRRRSGDQGCTEGVAVDLRQISVQDDHVVPIHECLLETHGTVVGDIGREPMVP